MRKNGYGELLEVIREAEVAAIEESAGLCRALQHQGAARAYAERKLIGFAGARNDFERVVVQAGIHFDLRDGVLHGENIAHAGNRFERADRIVADARAENFALGFVRGVAHADAHQKTVELRLRQRVRAVMLDRILRSDDEKRLWQRQSLA